MYHKQNTYMHTYIQTELIVCGNNKAKDLQTYKNNTIRGQSNGSSENVVQPHGYPHWCRFWVAVENPDQIEFIAIAASAVISTFLI